MKISSWYLPSPLHCEILFARAKVNRSAIANNTMDQLLLWHSNRNHQWKTWQGLLFRQHPPPVNVNVKKTWKWWKCRLRDDNGDHLRNNSHQSLLNTASHRHLNNYDMRKESICHHSRHLLLFVSEPWSSEEGEHLPSFKTSGSSCHCWWKVYSRDRGRLEIIDKDLDKDKDKDRSSKTKTLTETVWSDSPTH